MSDRRALVAIDLGAESCRVSLLRFLESGPALTLVHRFANGPVQTEDGLRWPLAAIEEGVQLGLRRCAEMAPEGIRSVGVDGWAVDYVRLAANGSALEPPYCYRDERTRAAEAWVHARVSEDRLRSLTGIQVQRINTAYQLVADSLTSRAPARWLNLPEYLLMRLGAEPVAELTNASHTQLVAAGAAAWSPEAFALLGLNAALAPRIVQPGTAVGVLRGPLAELPAFRQTLLIAPACHDTASAVAGIPAPQDGSDWAYISAGTWSLVGTVLPAPENGSRAHSGNYTNLAGVGGTTLFHKSLQGMWLLRSCMERWAQQADAPFQLEALIEHAARLPAPATLLQLDDPRLMYPDDMPASIAAQLREQGSELPEPAPGAAPAYAALIFHSLAAAYAATLRELAAITGRSFGCVYVVGGASRNGLLNRLIEEAAAMPVQRGPAEASTHGNFAVQLALLHSGMASAEAVAHWSRWLGEEAS